MGDDSHVRVVFEAVGVEDIKKAIENISGGIKDLGSEGQETDKKISPDKSISGAEKLSAKIKASALNFLKLGKEGKKATKDISDGMKDATSNSEKFRDSLKNVVKTAAMVFAKDFIGKGISEYGKTQTAMGEIKSLGVEDLEAIRKAAIEFSNTWSGTTREDFISASYDIKSGIASLTDDGVAQFTKMAALTGKATKSTVAEMTTLFAQGYSIYRNQFSSDDEFSEKFSAGISKSVEKFRTNGSETASFLSSLGASADKAGIGLSEVLAVGGELQATMSGSEAATKFQNFLESAAKAGEDLDLNFLDVNKRLKSIPEIINIIKAKYGNTIDAMESQELQDAFGTKEAVDMINLLYNKTKNVVDSTNELTSAMNGGAQATETMASAMNTGMVQKFDLLKQKVNNIFDSLGEKLEPSVSKALDGVFATLDTLIADGSIDSIAESIGQIVSTVLILFNDLLTDIPSIINTIASAVSWLAENFDTLIEIIKAGIIVWLSFKAIMLIITIVSNPVIAVIGLIVVAIVALYTKCETFRNIVQVAFSFVKLGVLELAKLWVMQFDFMVRAVDFLIGWIPGIGDALEGVSDTLSDVIGEIDKDINSTCDNIDDLLSGANKAKKAIDDVNAKEPPKDDKFKIPEFPKIPKEDIFEKSAASPKKSKEKKDDRTEFEKAKDEIDNEFKIREDLINSQIKLAEDSNDKVAKEKFENMLVELFSEKLGRYGSLNRLAANKNEKRILETAKNTIQSQIITGGGAGTEFERKKGNIEERYETKEDLIDSQINLAVANKDKSAKKEYQKTLLSVLNEKLSSYTELDKLAEKNSDEKNILESTRNKLLVKIAEITNDIKGNLGELIGEFNVPSELSTLTKYAYDTNTNSTFTRLVSVSPECNFYLTIKDLDKDGATKARNKAIDFMNYFVSKDSIVSDGKRDVVRN